MDAKTLNDSRVFDLPDAAATEAFGARLGGLLKPGDIVCLNGGLGAGKTTFARGAIRVWTGRNEEAPSPTYTIVQTYEGDSGSLWHVDLYRLKRPEECLELGLEDAFGFAACLIEWPERLGALLPRDHLDISFALDGDGRRVTLFGQSAWKDRIDAI